MVADMARHLPRSPAAEPSSGGRVGWRSRARHRAPQGRGLEICERCPGRYSEGHRKRDVSLTVDNGVADKPIALSVPPPSTLPNPRWRPEAEYDAVANLDLCILAIDLSFGGGAAHLLVGGGGSVALRRGGANAR